MKRTISESPLRFYKAAKPEIESILVKPITESYVGQFPYEDRRFWIREEIRKLEKKYFKDVKYDLVMCNQSLGVYY